MQVDVEKRQEVYLAEYQATHPFKREYGEALREKVMAALNPVLDAEETQPEVKQQLEGMFLGSKGRIQLGTAAVRALSEADLLDGFVSTTAQPDAPGWKHPNYGSNNRGIPTRYTSYFVRLPDGAEGDYFAIAEVGLKLDAEVITEQGQVTGDRDFTRWVLKRD